MHRLSVIPFVLALGVATGAAGGGVRLDVQILRSVGGLPPHIVGQFEEPLAFQQTPDGAYYVFDRRAHGVYAVDADRRGARKVVEIGREEGRILQPGGFDLAPDGSAFVVADAPRVEERIQFFGPTGAPRGGLPLVDPTGGYFYVFLAGRPVFQKFDAQGQLVFERHVEGVELDGWLDALPTTWPTRRVQDREVPYVTPTIRAAAVDGAGRLWLSLTVPFTYVYDAQGDKIRTVQFSAAGTISPTSLSFTRAGRLLVTPGCYEFDPGR